MFHSIWCRLAPSPGGRLVCLSMVALLAASILALVPGLHRSFAIDRSATAQRLMVPLLLPAASTLQAAHNPWQTIQVASGQTLGSVFASLGLRSADMHRLLASPDARPLHRLRAGAELTFEIDEHGQLRGLRFDRDEGHRVQLSLGHDSVDSTVIVRPIERRTVVASGEIRNSLFADGARAGLSFSVMNDMVRALQYDIDFAQDLRVGDRFQIVYEELWREGEHLRDDGVVAVNFINQGTPYTALRHLHDGRAEFFDLEGRPLRKEFMRTPVEFARLSSGFGARRHPILGRMRMHKGVDYAAPTGTPIMAAGNARVKFAGWQNGYGRTVILDHGNGINTLYAHMSRFGAYRTGERVRQGTVIGYIGMSGMATGPHLHYEFRVNGVHRDPLRVTLPKPKPLTGHALAEFHRATAPALAKLRRIDGAQLATR